jgi:choline dehydrogenase
VSAYDYIVVGAGSAGCAVAARLSENEDVTVLVLEAGGNDSAEDLRQPGIWPTLWHTEVDWAYRTTPQAGTGDLEHHWPRGKVVGGSSSINGMVWIRGHAGCFDSWADEGNTGWDYDSVLPAFQRMENVPGGDTHYRGSGGPLSPAPAATPNPLSLAFVEAAEELGHQRVADFNGPHSEGAGLHDLSIIDGSRQSAAAAYLHPAMNRSNLAVLTGAHVSRLTFSGTQCTGVEYVLDGQRLSATANAEVILSAGAIDSPRLLLLSGVGPAAELQEFGIEVVADLPGVGANLHDHPLLGVVFEADRPIPPPQANCAESSMYLRSDQALAMPDLQFMFIHVPFHPPHLQAPENSFTIAVGAMAPVSRGSLKLRSADPADHPLIDPNYLADEADVATLLLGVRKARELAATEAFSPWGVREILPGVSAESEKSLRDFIADGTGTYYHPVGTCRMGVDDQAVVDPTLKVHGLSGIRVADASIMPTIVSANTNPCSIMIGEKAADLVRGA